MLAASDVARIIVVNAIGRGHRGIILLDAALQLREELVLQRPGVGHDGFVIGVLALEEGADLCWQQGGIMHHLLPVRRFKPMIVVALLVAVPGFDARALVRPWRLRNIAHDLLSWCGFGLNVGDRQGNVKRGGAAASCVKH